MDSYGKLLMEYRKVKRVSQKQVAEWLTVHGCPTHHNQVSRWEQGKGEPSLQQFFLLCELYGIDDVMGVFGRKEYSPRINDKGLALVNAVRQVVEKSGLYAAQQPATFMRPIKVYDIPVSAGTGEFLDDGQFTIMEVDDTVPMAADFGLYVAGDSMEPRFTSGQIVWVKEQNTLDDGQIGVFSLNGEGYIKQLDNTDGTARLISLNNKYPPINVMEEDSLKVFGKVIG